MRGLRGKDRSLMAERLAATHKVAKQTIYRIARKDSAPPRKRRSDFGKRKYELVEGSDVWVAAQLVIHDRLDPDQALLTCKVRGYENLPSLDYFRKILRDSGLGKKARTKGRRAYRVWEAEHPGQLYQIDVTALKVRWEDEKTRRILRIEGIDKNHPQMDASKLRVWQIMAVDDCSRRRFLRYVTTTHVTSSEMMRFKCELYNKWGIPLATYTDHGSENKGVNKEAEKILNRVLEADGGYEELKHAPGNSQASGKVEVAHKWAEKVDKYVGLAVSEGQHVTVEDLNVFADAVCEHYNNRIHRATGETPLNRWYSRRVVIRKLPPEIIESALLSDIFTATLNEDMTVEHKAIKYSVPGKRPFVDYTGQKVKIVVPPHIDLILIALPINGEKDRFEEFQEIPKIIATADKAGEFKSVAESKAESLKKRLKESRKQDIRAIKKQNKLTGEIAPVPFFNVPIENEQTNVAHFPHKEKIASVEDVAAVTPIAPSVYKGTLIGYWEAVGMFADKFESAAEAREFLRTLFASDDERLPSKDVQSVVEGRDFSTQKTQLRAVK